MKAELYTEETPGTVANFVELANHNFYDGLTFHRVIPPRHYSCHCRLARQFQ